jgi:hypothetical protein
MAIEKEAIPYDEAVSYRSRVYATFNHLNTMFLMLQRTVKQKNSTNVGTITYNTTKNGCLRYLREINSLWQLDSVLIQQGSMTRQEQVYGKKTSYRSCYR